MGREPVPPLPADLSPRHPRARRRSAGRRLLAASATLLSAVVFVGSVGGWAAYREVDSSINRIHLDLGGRRPPSAGGAVNFLLIGSDRRGDGRDGVVQGQRSDTTILAHLASDGTSTLVSFPRDMYVPVPAAEGASHPEQRRKLTEVIEVGGVALLVRTLERLTGLHVDHFVSVDFQGFQKITSALGGVEVCVRAAPGDRNLFDKDSGWRGRVGVNRLDGEQALAFVRTRKTLPNGDLDRIRRQQQFIGAMVRTTTSTGVLLNPVRIERLLTAVGGSITTDDRTGRDDLLTLARRLRGLEPGMVRFVTVPTRAPGPRDPGAFYSKVDGLWEIGTTGAVQVYDPPALEAIVAPLRDDRPAGGRAEEGDRSTAARPVPPPVGTAVPPSHILVSVRNGTASSGLAATVTAELADLGYRTDLPGNAPTTGAPATRPVASQVRYGPGQEAAARTLTATVPDSVAVADPALGGELVLVLGSSYRRVRPPSAGPEPRAAPPAASPADGNTPAATTAADAANRCTY